jgi:transketolase
MLDSILACQQIRLKIVETCYKASVSHVGSCLSIVELLYAIYTIKQKDDTFILSKGHAAIAVYAILNHFGQLSDDTLANYGTDGSSLCAHVTDETVDWSTGSLGHGLPVSTGFAWAAPERKHYIILSDGELNEGSNWEALFFLSKNQHPNLTIIIDSNKLQGVDQTDDILEYSKYQKMLRALEFDWFEIDGHLLDDINKTLNTKTSKTKVIWAHTIKGRGVGFMENTIDWHYKSPSKVEFEQALLELIP